MSLSRRFYYEQIAAISTELVATAYDIFLLWLPATWAAQSDSPPDETGTGAAGSTVIGNGVLLLLSRGDVRAGMVWLAQRMAKVQV